MLKGIMNKLGISPDIEEEVTMSVANLAPANLNIEAVVAELSTLKASFEDQANVLAGVISELAQANVELAAFKEAAVQAEADMLAMKMAKRKADVEMNIGENEQSAALLEATSAMTDEQFAAVVGAMGVKAKAEAESPMFKEAGVEAGLENTVSADATSLLKKMQAKYAAKK